MSRYSGYYRKKNETASTTVRNGTDATFSGKTIKASTSRETHFYESPEETIRKWREQMSRVYSNEQILQFMAVRNKLDFDRFKLKV